MTDQQRLEKVAEYARRKILEAEDPNLEKSSQAGPAYRWEHTLRVAHYGKLIAKAEGANVELCAAACLLHDVEWFGDSDYSSHGRKAAQVIGPFLEQAGYTPAEADSICYSVAVHVDGNAGYDHEHTLEAKVVSDADNVDRFGAYRILLWCVDEMDDLPALAEKLKKRLIRLEELRGKDVLETATGSRLFREQVQKQIDFFNRIVEEYQMTNMEPGYLD